MALNISDPQIFDASISPDLIKSILAPFAGKLDFILTLSKVLLIITIIYFIILIISNLFKMRDSHKLSIIADNVSEINQKLSSFLDKKSKVDKKVKGK